MSESDLNCHEWCAIKPEYKKAVQQCKSIIEEESKYLESQSKYAKSEEPISEVSKDEDISEDWEDSEDPFEGL